MTDAERRRIVARVRLIRRVALAREAVAVGLSGTEHGLPELATVRATDLSLLVVPYRGLP